MTDPSTYIRFRLRQSTLTQLEALARSSGTVSQAFREAVCYWHAAVWGAAQSNAEEFSEEDWHLLAAVEPGSYDLADGEVEDGRLMPVPVARQWGPLLAQELLGRWEGRTVLPLHRAEVEATRKLAGRVARLDMVRGAALYAALRWWWGQRGETPGAWWRPEVWMGVSDAPE